MHVKPRNIDSYRLMTHRFCFTNRDVLGALRSDSDRYCGSHIRSPSLSTLGQQEELMFCLCFDQPFWCEMSGIKVPIQPRRWCCAACFKRKSNGEKKQEPWQCWLWFAWWCHSNMAIVTSSLAAACLTTKLDSFGEFQHIANLFPCFSYSHRIHVWYIC